MGILSNIFATKENVTKGMDAVIKSGDALFYTDEEKAQNRAKYMDWLLKFYETTNPQNLARRVLAFMVIGLWLFLLFLAALAWPFSKEYAEFLIGMNTDPSVALPVGGIMAFYFGTHLLRAKEK